MSSVAQVVAFSLSLLLFASCSSEPDNRFPKSEVEDATETLSGNAGLESEADLFQGRGKVLRLIANGTFVELDHEDIPGYMSAMSMLFPIADTSMIRRIATGDSVRFQISGGGEILQISRIGG